MRKFKDVIVIGGGGYVGAVLVPKLLKRGYRVKVYDLFIYGKEVFDAVKDNPNLSLIEGDVRDIPWLEEGLKGIEAIIHLACISNDPSFELDPELGKSINYDCFEPLVKMAKEKGIRRFIYASSSSVYGVKEAENVTEEIDLQPLTDYSRFKVICEEVLFKYADDDFVCLVLRPATVCGYSPRQRMDLIVNILTNHAVNRGQIIVNGGNQKRPNIHIEDVTDLYVKSLEYEDELINKKIFNAGYENFTVSELARQVKEIVGAEVDIIVEPTNDPRSYHISSKKIRAELGFTPRHTIEDAVRDLKKAIENGWLKDPMNNPLYFNIKRMKEIELS
ncbi:MAG: SDR family oxidoreductase [Candidatus Euphemobacter frigidus]|nr:SDR family oxidoreductase [Candidatus Euphemobacter frigidus]MDP8276613.1 SDR family oxidoreductase [Candidatus Euphemobacter frigidus]